MVYLGALLLGVVSGLRTFTSPAVLLLTRGGIAGIIVSAFALLEFAGDLFPKAPARTSALPLAARIVSGTFVGWLFAASHGASIVAGAVLGIAGALAGAFGGYALRMKAIAAVGAISAALAEDAIAIALAALAALKFF